MVALVVAESDGRGELPATGEVLRVAGVEVDAVTADESGRLTVRAHEAHGSDGSITIAGPHAEGSSICPARSSAPSTPRWRCARTRS